MKSRPPGGESGGKGENMRKTKFRFDWLHGHTIAKRLTRSFDALADAEQFAKGKNNTEIYKSKGRYVVEWTKTIDNNPEPWDIR